MRTIRVNPKPALDFLELQKKIPTLIEDYKIEKKYLIDNLEMSKQTFYNKMKKKTFTAHEILEICRLIDEF